jgi:hypothetical protein
MGLVPVTLDGYSASPFYIAKPAQGKPELKACQLWDAALLLHSQVGWHPM